jgi:sec-independent protein translocase protein TatB
MFDVGWSELVVIGVVALVVIGPRDLPGALRTLGRMVGQVKRMASDFQGQFNEALREAELDGLRREVDDLRRSTRSALETPDLNAMMRQPLSSQVKNEAVAAGLAEPEAGALEMAGNAGENTAKPAAKRAKAATKTAKPAAKSTEGAKSTRTAKAAKPAKSPVKGNEAPVLANDAGAEPHPADLPVPPDPERSADFDKAEKRK